MAIRETMNVSVTPELERFVAEQLATGRYQSASEVVRDGLRLLQAREDRRQAALSNVRRKVAEGLAAADRGELFDGAEVRREIAAMSAKRRNSKKK